MFNYEFGFDFASFSNMQPFHTKTNDALDASKTYFQIKPYRKLYIVQLKSQKKSFISSSKWHIYSH